MLDLLRSFLLSRKQRDVLNGQCSNWELISSGVLQGSTTSVALNYLLIINTSLFSIVHDEAKIAFELSQDLERFSPGRVNRRCMSVDVARRLEQTQLSAALAMTGAWRGTIRKNYTLS